MNNISFVIPTIGESKKLLSLISFLLENCLESRIYIVNNSVVNKLNLPVHSDRLYIYNFLERNVSKSRNFGANRVLTDVVYFLDDDVLPQKSWLSEVKKIMLNHEYKNAIIGGPVYTKNKIKVNVPIKYRYLIGEKLSNRDGELLSGEYLSGCNILMDINVFFKIGGFLEEYGHQNGEVRLNEEVLFQDRARQLNVKILNCKRLIVDHYWYGNYIDIIRRASIQGIYDRKGDLKNNKVKFFARVLKYICMIPFILLSIKLSNAKSMKNCLNLKKYTAYLNFFKYK